MLPRLLAAAVVLLAQAAPATDAAPGEAVVEPGQVGVIDGRAFDPEAEQPAAGLLVALHLPSGAADRTWPEPWVYEPGEEARPIATVRTDADGRFRFAGLASGDYEVRVADHSLERSRVAASIRGASMQRTVELAVRQGGTARGRVVDAAGAPLVDFWVLAVGVDLGDGLNALDDAAGPVYTRSDAEGRFTLRPLPTGEVYIQAALRPYGYSLPVAHPIRSGEEIDGLEIVVPDERALLERRRRSDGGVGIRIDFGPAGPSVSSLIEGMGAKDAGLLAGDLVVEVAGRSTGFMTPVEFTDRCRGELGSEVRLRVVRDGGEPFDVSIVRSAFP